MNLRILAAAERVVTHLFTFGRHSRGSFRTTGLARLFFGLVLRLELFRGERLLAGAFVGVPVGLAGNGVLERLGVVSHRGGKVTATVLLRSRTVV